MALNLGKHTAKVNARNYKFFKQNKENQTLRAGFLKRDFSSCGLFSSEYSAQLQKTFNCGYTFALN